MKTASKKIVLAAFGTALLVTALATQGEAAPRRPVPPPPERNCGVSIGGVGMPQGAMALPAVGERALESRGYTVEASYHADLFLWVDVNCILGPLGSICTPTAILKDIITQKELARATGASTAAFGVYSVAPETAIALLPTTLHSNSLYQMPIN